MADPSQPLHTDRRHQEPLHSVLARRLKERIDDRIWAAGARVPSVRTLAREFGVSMVTVSRALQLLVTTGLVVTYQGKGTYVATPSASSRREALPDFGWQNALLRPPGTARLVGLVSPANVPPDTISLASGGVGGDLIPSTALERAVRQALADGRSTPPHEGGPSRLLQVRSPAGEPTLRMWMARYLESAGIQTDAEHVLVTAGGQQALNLVARTVLRPGDTVLVERPTYMFALAIFESLGIRCVEIPVDEHGLRVDMAQDLFARVRPTLLFTVPTGHAPTGVTMPLVRRRALLDAARQYGVIIMEEDYAREFSYGQPSPPAIKSLDTDGHVIYVRSFSKITLSSLRIGCLVADGPVYAALVEAKRVADRYTSTLTQDVFLAYVNSSSFQPTIARARARYQERRDVMLACLEREMPSGVAWTVPTASFNVWVTLPPGISARKMAQQAAANGVLIVPSEPFFYHNDPDNGLRLTFSDHEPARLTEGICRLARIIQEAMKVTQVVKGATSEIVMA